MPATAWPTEPGTGRGRSHGTSSAEPFDRWFRYPAGFASDYVRLLVDHLGLREGVLLDCFMGSGVTGTAALSRGLTFGGIEAHPLIAELATLKLLTPIDAGKLKSAAKTIAAAPRAPCAAAGETSLVKRSFPGDVLGDLVAMREAIKGLDDTDTACALKWALLGTLRDVADVKVGWPYQRPGVARRPRYKDARQRFIARADIIAEDVRPEHPEVASPVIVVGDASTAHAWQPIPRAHGCITSPPYLNNFDYADATRLELYFWGDVSTWREMCEWVRSDMVIATTQQSSKQSKEDALARLTDDHGQVGAQISGLARQLLRMRVERGGRTKEYDQVVPPYFVAMADVLTHLHAKLEPGARAVWLVGDSAPYGVHIDTPDLIGKLATSLGFEFEQDILLRRRGRRWNRTLTRELSERMIVLHKPG